jgi:glycine cleavage system regulatory protein
MSNTSLVLTVLGRDRPGLVDSLAQVVAEHGGNWVESRMAHLAGQFAGILRVEVAVEQAEPLTTALKNLAGVGLESVVQPDLAAPAEGQPPLVQLSLVGQDRPGIIREVSQVLAAHGVNFEELNTECTNAPNSGQALFRATAQLRLPAHISAEALREAVEQVAADMMGDVTLE